MSDLRTHELQAARSQHEAPAAQEGHAGVAGWGPLVVVLVGTFVTLLDFFIVNVALSGMQVDLGAGASSLSLVVAGYGLSFAAGLITAGRLGDLYGRRRMFRLGLALFTVASAACGLAPTAEVLVIARLLQGAAASLLTPQVLAILGVVYEGQRRDRAFAAYGFTMGIAAVLGQLLGGVLITTDLAGLGWRSIFLINVPVGLIALPVAGVVVPESRGPRAGLDFVGTALGTAAVAALVFPLAEGAERGWPLWTWVSLAAVPAVALGFVATQRRRSGRGLDALVQPGLFRVRTFRVGMLAAFAFALVPASFFFILALYLQQGRGYSALFSGVVFVAVGVGYFAAMFAAGSLQKRLGYGVLMLGAGATAAGCAVVAQTARASSSLGIAPGLALVGLGIGLVLVPLASTVLAGIDPQHAGAAAGVLATAQQVGGAVGVALTSAIFFGAGEVVHAFIVSSWFTGALAVLALGFSSLLRPRWAITAP